jgi:hypothetical protein
MADIPGGASGIQRRDYKGKEADRLVTRITPAWSCWSRNCAATSARRPRNWSSGRRTTRSAGLIDASPAAITLALLLTDEELDTSRRVGAREVAQDAGLAPAMSGTCLGRGRLQSARCRTTPRLISNAARKERA